MPAGLSGYLLSASFLDGRLGTGRASTSVHDGSSPLPVRPRARSGLLPAFDRCSSRRGPHGRRPWVRPTRGCRARRRGARLDFAAGNDRIALIVAPGRILWISCRLSASDRRRSDRPAGPRFSTGRTCASMDTALPHSRRFVQFDLDTVADDEGAFAAFVYVMACLPGSLRSLVEASEQHGAAVCRSLKNGVLSASADVLRALRPALAISHRLSRRFLRAGTDDRVPHPVPAVRRGARASCRCGIRCTATATASRRSAPSPNEPACATGCGRRFARSRAWHTPAAARATCG